MEGIAPPLVRGGVRDPCTTIILRPPTLCVAELRRGKARIRFNFLERFRAYAG